MEGEGVPPLHMLCGFPGSCWQQVQEQKAEQPSAFRLSGKKKKKPGERATSSRNTHTGQVSNLQELFSGTVTTALVFLS